MVDPASSLSVLLDAPIRAGQLRWIGLRTARRERVSPVAEAMAEVGRGLAGDRYSRAGGARQVTLIASESLRAIASHLGLEAVAPALLRRNLVIEGLNLFALKGRRFSIGPAVLEATGECHPCSRMEEVFGPGGYNAVRGHGGITARVVTGGAIAVGDPVVRLNA